MCKRKENSSEKFDTVKVKKRRLNAGIRNNNYTDRSFIINRYFSILRDAHESITM